MAREQALERFLVTRPRLLDQLEGRVEIAGRIGWHAAVPRCLSESE